MKQRFSTRTRLVSALLTLAMVFTFLPFSAFAEEELTDNYGIIPLAEYVIPDEAFRKYLKKFDTNNDDILAPAERYAVKEIDVSGKYISNLYGIQFFPNLKKLVCYNKQLTSLDVSQNTALEYLDCSNNQLTSLDVSQNPALQTLDCSNNQLTSLDVRQNTKLDVVWCYQNQLTELDVRQNAALEYLYCQENQLTELDVRKNIALQNLACYSNALTSLDVSKNTQLKKLYCYSNQLTSLDVSRNPALLLLSCGINQLTELDVSQNPALKYLYCSDNQLTELDVSRNNKIFVLEANNNYLTSLNVDNTSIDIDNSSSIFAALGNTYPITVGSDRSFDLSTLPGTFDVTKATRWNGGTVRGNTLTVKEGATKVTYLYNCGKRSSYTFTLNVTVVPDGTVTPPEPPVTPPEPPVTPPEPPVTPPEPPVTPPEPPVTPPSGGGDGGGAVVIVAAAGAAVAGVVGYGVYNYVSGRKLQALLPEGVAAPENRAQTALLLWNTAGRPEPAEAPAFADVADPDTAKAAQWCVEQGLMKRRLNGKFAPGSSIPAYQVLNAYRKLAG